MKTPDFVSALADRFSDFLSFRRAGGVDSPSQIQLLRHFDGFLYQERFQGGWPTREVVERYLATAQHLHPGTRQNRLSLLRQFCRYLRQLEPECFIPERTLVRQRRPSQLPHIYTGTEIEAMLQAARKLPPLGSLRPKTYSTLFGLLYTTGLRCGEAFALNRTDVDLKRALWYLAFEAHRQGGTADAETVADIGESRLHQTLVELHPDKSYDWAYAMVEVMKLRAGLLLERAPGVYTFPHRTFQ